MSIMKLLGVRSWFLSFVEIVFFFCVLSVLYFAVMVGGYRLLAVALASNRPPPADQYAASAPASQSQTASAPASQAQVATAPSPAATQSQSAPASQSQPASAAAVEPAKGSWLTTTPAWMWIIAAVGYVLLVTLYWAPGDQQLDDTELRAFGVFVVVVLAGGLLYLELAHHRVVSDQLELFWKIVSGHYTAAKAAAQ